MWYATQARENYPYYQHEVVGYNYRLSNISACIGRAQMTILDDHIAHHKHVHELYCRLMADIPGIHIHSNPWPEADSNYWLVTATLDPDLKIKNEDKAYNQVMTKTVGGVAAITHAVSSATTDCQPNTNVEALRMALDAANIEARPLWKPMHRQPVFKNSPAYINGNSEAIFKQGICLPAGPYVTDEDVAYIVATIRDALA